MRLLCWLFGLVYANVEEPLADHKRRAWAQFAKREEGLDRV